jgi:hypothetical protein
MSLLCLRSSVFSLFAFLVILKSKLLVRESERRRRRRRKKNQRAKKKNLLSLSLSLSLSLLNVFSNCARTPPTPTPTQRQHAHALYKMAKRTKSARKTAKKSASVRVYGRLFRFVGFYWGERFEK